MANAAVAVPRTDSYKGSASKRREGVLADAVYVDHSHLPPAMVARLVRLAAFQNPALYRAQAMRLPTFSKQRIVSCAELYPHHVALLAMLWMNLTIYLLPPSNSRRGGQRLAMFLGFR